MDEDTGAAGALAVFEADDAAALLDDDPVLKMLALAASICFCVRDEDDDAAGSLSAGGMTTAALEELAFGVVAGPALGLTGTRDGVVASGRSLKEGAEEVEEAAAAAGAEGRVDLSRVRPLVSILSIAVVARLSKLPAMVKPIEQTKKAAASHAVKVVSRFPAPRADMKPEGPPPMPSAPPSERWIRINPPMLTQMMI